jgi:beta-lactamase regulating signal transducer with metallopeptidase domain
MSIWLDAASVAATVNVVLLLALSGIWARNYLQFRSKHPLGLLVFGLALLAENCLSFYYYVLDPQVADLLQSASPVAGRAMAFVQVLELLAILALVWITWD